LTLKKIEPIHLKKILSNSREIGMYAGLSDKRLMRVGWQGSSISLEIPKPGRYWRPVTLDYLKDNRLIKSGHTSTLGVGLQDEPRRISFDNPATAHVMIAGQTRSGKTNAQRLLAWNLAHNMSPTEANLVIFDVAKRGRNWKDFSNVSHVLGGIVTDIQTAEKTLAWCTLEIDRRGMSGRTSPKIYIIIDELRALIEDSEAAMAHLARIAAVGGEFGLHLVVATQYPQVSLLGGSGRGAELKRNITTRLCGRVDDATAAQNSVGVPNSGAESLLGYGDFLLRDVEEGVNRLSTAKLEPCHVESLPQGATASIELPESDVVYREPGAVTPPNIVMPTAQESAKILALWHENAGASYVPGLNKVKKEIGGADSTVQKKRQYVIDLVEALKDSGVSQIEIDNLPTKQYGTKEE
jgi:hypothetical protein